MSYYQNPQPGNYNIQNIYESIQGKQVYSPQKNYAAPPPLSSSQFRQSQVGNLDYLNKGGATFSGNHSRLNSSFIPVSSMQDIKITQSRQFTAGPIGTSSYGQKPLTRNYIDSNDDKYLNPPPLNYNTNPYGSSSNPNFSSSGILRSQVSPQLGSSRFQESKPYGYQDEQKITQYVGSYVRDPTNALNQPIPYNRSFESRKFENNGYNITASQSSTYLNNKTPLGYNSVSRLDTIQSRRDEGVYTSSFERAEPATDYLRQSFGKPSQFQQSPSYLGSGVGDSVIGSKSMGDLDKSNVKRDQNFYYDSYITINGLGTYKKYPLKLRKTATASQNNQDPNERSQQLSQRGGNSGFEGANYEKSQYLQSQQQPQNDSKDEPMTVHQFMQILLELSKAEAEIENVKNQLLNQSDYHIPTLFQYFDKNNSGKLALYEFQQGQKNIGLNLSQLQISLIFTRIVPSTTSLITYEDFEQLCLPLLSNEVGKYVTSRRVLERNMSEQTIDLFRRLLHYIYESESQIDVLRKKIFKSQTRVDQFYRNINSERNGRVTISELESSLNKYTDQLSAFQVAALFYRICQNKSTYLTYDTFERFCYGGESGRQQFFVDISKSNNNNSSYSQYKLEYNDSKFRRNDFNKIIEKLIANTNLEVDIESIQKYLITKRDLKLHNLFGMFRPEKNFVDVYSFTETLKTRFNIPLVDHSDTALLFRKIKNTNSQPDLIDFSEFCNLIIPKNEQPSRELFDHDRAGDLEFYSETQTFLQKLFKAHLNNEVIFNEVRLEIQTKSINMNDLFDFLSKGKSYLEKSDFDKTLKENNSPHPTRYHDLIFSRFDKGQEGITNFTNFAHTLRI